MLEILCKVLFFLSMLVLYANVTSTSIVIVIVLGYILCVFSYYYFNNIQGAIDECFNYCNFNTARFSDSMNPSQVSGYFMNRKYSKINNSGITPLGGKKVFSALCNSDSGFPKENSLLDSCGPSIMKADFKNGELPSPILKNVNSPLRNAKLSRDKLKITFSLKEVARKNGYMNNPLNPTRRYNANLDLETYMNVNSPGFTSRVVDKAAESASYHLKYPAVRQVSSYRFDKSTLRQLSKIPRVNSTPAVRIAPPEASSLNLPPTENITNENVHEDVRNNSILQVLKDMSRKRNYSQEETDRSGSTPKKSRKNEMKNVITPQYKRAHEDCSNDSIEDKSRKKRCDDTDRDIVKMMSYTSGLSVQGFTWESQPKKRKSSKLEKSKNESPEKLEKFRKISEDSVEEKKKLTVSKESSKTRDDTTTTEPSPECESEKVQVYVDKSTNNIDETDNEIHLDSLNDEDGDYVRVAGGKILNRTNCRYRRKLNSKKIDPISVISTEPEYVSPINYINDKDMKESLLNNLMNDVERKGEKNDCVIFYQNSILEDVANKVVVEVDVHQPETVIHTASTIKPLEPPMTKLALFNISVPATSKSEIAPPTTSHTPSALPSTADKTNPLLSSGTGEFTFGSKGLDVVDAPKTIIPTSETKTSQEASNSAITCTTQTDTNNSITEKTTAPSFSAVVSQPVTTSAAPLTLNFNTGSNFSFTSSDAATSDNNNPLLTKPIPITVSQAANPQPSLFGAPSTANNTATSAQFPCTTPKIAMFGNTIISQASASPVTSSNVFSAGGTMSTSTTSALSSATQSSSITTPSFQFGQASAAAATTTTVSPSTTTPSNNFSFGLSSISAGQGGFKFGASQAAVTTSGPAFSVTSSSTSAAALTPAPAFGATTALSFGNSFGATTTASSFEVTNTPSFGAAASSAEQASSTFKFNAQSSNAFGSGSVFNSAFQTNTTQPNVFGSLSTPAAPQVSMFGKGGSPSLTFGTSAQSASAPSMFGTSNSQSTQSQPSVFGASSQATVQPSAFGQSTQSGPSISFGATSQTIGGGDASASDIFGQSQSAAPVATVNPLSQNTVNPLSQNTQFGGSDRFVFGGNNQQTPAFSAAASSFGGGASGPGTFGSSPSTFNFSSGSSFGSNNAGSTFAASSNAQAGGNPLFNFGTGGNTAMPQQAAFQFNSNVPSQPNQASQPFMFGGGRSTPVAASAGGFSIGSGGGSSSTARNRALARPRKAK